MANREHPIRDGFLVTVGGGLVLSGLGKLSGIAPQVWDFIVRGSSASLAARHRITQSLYPFGFG